MSICIPTYNRCNYLERTLCSIVDNEGFDERTEIIISDNCSTDETSKIAQKYTMKYSNIHYFKNSENIKDRNFFVSLERGRGCYLKLLNDTARLKKGSLKNMLDIIDSTSDKKLVFFYNNESSFHSNEICHVISLSSFLSSTSFYMTWIANFGLWAHLLHTINKPFQYSSLMLLQVDWQLQLIKNVPSADIIWGDFIAAEDVEGKGGYNIFKVFVENYLFLLRKNLGRWNYCIAIEKYRLLKFFLIPWINILILTKDKKYAFDTKGYKSILFREYWYTLYIYLFALKELIRYLKRKYTK